MTTKPPATWDLETDVVALGSGIGGLSAAITAHDEGLQAVVLERAEQVGGVTALSLGEVWVAGNHLAAAKGVEDSVQSGYRYLKRLGMDYGDDGAMLNYAVHAREALKYFEAGIGLRMRVITDMCDYYYGISNDGVAEGRMLEVEPFSAAGLGEWQSRTRVSPHVPYGFIHDDMFSRGGAANMQNWDYAVMGERLMKDERCLGPGLAGYFVKGALDRGIPLITGANAVELITDGEGRVIGVRAQREGEDFFVRARRGVVVAVSGYEKNAGYNRTLGGLLESQSMVFPTIDGANLRLAGPLGARIARVPDVTMFGFHVPGEERDDGEDLWRVGLGVIALPHTIVVNRKGERFGNEAFYRDICYAVDHIDGVTQTHRNFPCWAIFDSQARGKYAFGSVMAGQDLPEGLGVKADTLAELAGKIGVDAAGLEATVARFNAHAAKGEDPDFQRGQQPWARFNRGDPLHKPNPCLGPVETGPFYAVEMHRMGGSAIPSTGLLIDEHARVMGWNDQPIEGLYAAGNSTARMETGAMMQSGVSNGRGMTQGYLAALHAAGKPSALLAQAKREGALA